jgi:hypothetical protein
MERYGVLFRPMNPDEIRSRRHKAVAACATLLLGTAVLAACSGSPSKGASGVTRTTINTTTKTTGLPEGSIPSSTTTTLPTAGTASGATCTKKQVVITVVDRGITKTSDTAVFAVTNSSSSRCSLTGYPNVVLVGTLGPLAVKTVDGSVAGATQLATTVASLAPRGGQASFAASWTFPTNGANCPDGTGAAITLPGVTGADNVATDITACGGAINVSPIQPNVIVQG